MGLCGDVGVLAVSIVCCVGVLGMVCGAQNLNKDDYDRLKRGLDPAMADRVLKAKSFVCDDGAVVLDLSAVNDDYCDCEDGTDEYGTAACNNGLFTCISLDENGEVQKVFSGLVNDDICDCCDCSDEWMRPDWRKPPCERKDPPANETGNNKTEQVAVRYAHPHGVVIRHKGGEAYVYHAWTCAIFASIVSAASSFCIVKYLRRRKRPSVRSFTPRLTSFI